MIVRAKTKNEKKYLNEIEFKVGRVYFCLHWTMFFINNDNIVEKIEKNK